MCWGEEGRRGGGEKGKRGVWGEEVWGKGEKGRVGRVGARRWFPHPFSGGANREAVWKTSSSCGDKAPPSSLLVVTWRLRVERCGGSAWWRWWHGAYCVEGCGGDQMLEDEARYGMAASFSVYEEAAENRGGGGEEGWGWREVLKGSKT